MLEEKPAVSQADLAKRISELRNPSEPSEPTEEAKPVDVSVEDETSEIPEEEVTESEEEAETLEATGAVEESQETEDVVYDIAGEEISLSQILSWKKGNMQEADYTQKSQANADLRKSLEAEKLSLQERGSGLQTLIDSLEGSINADITDDHLAQLLEDDDTGEYLRLTEKKKLRLSKLDAAKTERSKLKSERLTATQQAGNKSLIDLNPSWTKDGQLTQAGQDDQALLLKHAKDNGFTQAEIDAALSSGKIMQAMINAEKLKAKVAKAPALSKKVRTAPTIIKGKQRQVSNLDKQIQDASARLKKTGRTEDAVALRKLKRQRTG